MAYIISSGESSSGITVGYTNITILDGGTASNTTIGQGGGMYVSSGGTATDTVVNYRASMFVSSGGTAKGVTITSGASFFSFSGGTVNSAVVDKDVYLQIASGCTVNSVTFNSGASVNISALVTISDAIVNSGASVQILSGGIATGITENGGYVEIKDDTAVVTFSPNVFSRLKLTNLRATVHSGTTANITSIGYKGGMYVYDGGSANFVAIASSGYLLLSSGATANDIELLSGGTFHISSGGVANSVTVYSGGTFYVSSGGMVNRANVNDYYCTVRIEGGTANSVTLFSSGNLYVSNGGTANFTTITPGARMFLRSGVANSTTISEWGSLFVESGGTANRTMVGSGAYLFVLSGGTATELDWTPCVGTVSVSEGARVTFLSNYTGVYYGSNDQLLSNAATIDSMSIGSGGNMYVFSNGAANDIEIDFDGYLWVGSGGTLNNVALYSYGNLFVASGGTAINVDWAPLRGTIIAEDGAYVTFTSEYSGVYYGRHTGLISQAETMEFLTISSGYEMLVLSDGIANSTTVSAYGSLSVSSGGTANSTTISSGGMLYVFSGGTANSATLHYRGSICVFNGGSLIDATLSGGTFHISRGGTVIGAKISSGGLSVFSGGTANSASISFDGLMYVSGGGTANGIELKSGGTLFVSSGATATDIDWTPCVGRLEVEDGAHATFVSEYSGVYFGYAEQLYFHYPRLDTTLISSGGRMYVMSDGIANDTTISNGGSMYIWLGGVANSTTVSAYGSMNISSGGVANDTTINRYGSIFVYSGATANSTVVNSYGSMHVSTGGVANDTTINRYGSIFIHSGATANSITFGSDGSLYISSGAVVNYTMISAGGSKHLLDGTVMNDTMIYSGGHLYIRAGGTANGAAVNHGGELYISSGGTATDILENGGFVFSESDSYITFVSHSLFDLNLLPDVLGQGISASVHSGTTANRTAIYSHCNMHVYSGGIANDTILSGGYFAVSSGGVAERTVVSNTGSMRIFSGGTANDTTINGRNGYDNMRICSGGIANRIVINSGTMYLSGGVANDATINNSAHMIMFGGVANGTEINGIDECNGGQMYIYGGVANSTTVSAFGSMHIDSDGVANSTTVSAGGNMFIASGGVAEKTVLNDGELIVFADGIANSTTVNAGRMIVSSGGTANCTTVNIPGSFEAYSCSFVNNLFVASKGIAQVDGKLSGLITVENGASIIMGQESVLDFDLRQTSPLSGALVDGFSRIKGDPTYSLTLTVGPDQPVGIYLLAQGVYAFDKTISVTDESGEALGELSVGETVSIGDMSYTLSLNNASLFLSIREPGPDAVAPEVFCVRQSDDAPTLRAVTVTAAFADDVELKSSLYRIGENGAWTDYVGGVTVTENTTVYFMAVDASGNESEVVSHSVTNIEKHAHDPVYVYLDFDGENTVYHNQDLNLSLDVTLADPGYSGVWKQTIWGELTDKYVADGVVFTLTRPENAEYSTVYFGTSDAFSDYGEYFGISETLDKCNRIKNDNAFVLLDNSYSIDQILSVAETALDHILGFTCLQKEVLKIRDYAVNSYLLSTKWNQKDPYNKYCPIMPGSNYRLPTGCVKTAVAQLLYYWIENGMLDFILSLDESDYALHAVNDDEYIRFDFDPLTVAKYGYLSYEETNELLSGFQVDDEDSIAALNFAVHFLIPTGFIEWDGTPATLPSKNTFLRSGFKHFGFDYGVKFVPDITNDDKIRNKLIQNMLAGEAACAGILYPLGKDNYNVNDAAHEIVIDGYNSATGEFHANFGWGGISDGWYSWDVLTEYYGLYDLLCDVMPEELPVLSVSGLSFEQDVVKQGNDFVINLSLSNSGNIKSTDIEAYVYCGDKLIASQLLDFLYPRETRVFSFAVDSSEFSLGENAITVKVGTQKDDGISFASGTIQVYDQAMADADDVKPTVTEVKADTVDSVDTVTVTAVFSDNFALASSLYKLGENGEWTAYRDGVTVTENTTVYFKAIDEAGNESEIVGYEVKNIDKEKPVITLAGNNQTPLQQVVLTAETDDGSEIFYSLDQETWTPYTEPITVNANATYYFKATDAAGNEGTNSITFASIDTVAPVITLTGDNRTPRQQTTLTAAVDDGSPIVYSTDEVTWLDYTGTITVDENATYYFKATDAAGNEDTKQITFTNIDTVAPVITLACDNQMPLQKATLTASTDDGSPIYYRIGDTGDWMEYKEPITVTDNVTYTFKATDAAGNEGTNFLTFENIDTVAPVITLTGDNRTPLRSGSLTASTDDGSAIVYSTDEITWLDYTGTITVDENATYYFKATDAAGNEGTAEYVFENIDTVPPALTLSGDNETQLEASTLTAEVDDDSEIFYSLDNVTWAKYEGVIPVDANATYYFKAVDAAGNYSTAEYVFANILPKTEVVTQTQTWEAAEQSGGVGEETQYVVEYTLDNFEHVIQIIVNSNGLDSFQMPAGTYQWRVKSEDTDDWSVGQTFVAAAESDTPKVVQSNADGNDDLFFASTNGTWENIYYAQNVGSINDWTGTNEIISANGKGRIQNLFFGSSDPNVLCLTDGENGDAIFVDDVYTELPESVAEHTARLYKIQEVRAGAGDDIIDMTSQRFEYVGDGLTIRGGEGNDTIWATKGNNWLFGDAGDDRIVGASGNDVIAGGIGNDRMHGGGGEDIFTFCDNWGIDTVEQLTGGKVTLWFVSGDKSNWNEAELIYTDGDNSVTVKGVASVELKFGDDGSDKYDELVAAGAFTEFTSQKIFEESGKGMLA